MPHHVRQSQPIKVPRVALCNHTPPPEVASDTHRSAHLCGCSFSGVPYKWSCVAATAFESVSCHCADPRWSLCASRPLALPVVSEQESVLQIPFSLFICFLAAGLLLIRDWRGYKQRHCKCLHTGLIDFRCVLYFLFCFSLSLHFLMLNSVFKAAFIPGPFFHLCV